MFDRLGCGLAGRPECVHKKRPAQSLQKGKMLTEELRCVWSAFVRLAQQRDDDKLNFEIPALSLYLSTRSRIDCGRREIYPHPLRDELYKIFINNKIK